MVSAPQANKHDQAVRVRDVCLELIKTHGQLREINGYVVTEIAVKRFTVWLVPWRHPATLDIWYEGAGKVLSLRHDESTLNILSFRRGKWEGELLELRSQTSRL